MRTVGGFIEMLRFYPYNWEVSGGITEETTSSVPMTLTTMLPLRRMLFIIDGRLKLPWL